MQKLGKAEKNCNFKNAFVVDAKIMTEYTGAAAAVHSTQQDNLFYLFWIAIVLIVGMNGMASNSLIYYKSFDVWDD